MEYEITIVVDTNDADYRTSVQIITEEELDRLNQRLGEVVIADGRFMAGTSRIGARTIFRPAFSNWRTRNRDVEEFANVVVELGQGLL